MDGCKDETCTRWERGKPFQKNSAVKPTEQIMTSVCWTNSKQFPSISCHCFMPMARKTSNIFTLPKCLHKDEVTIKMEYEHLTNLNPSSLYCPTFRKMHIHFYAHICIYSNKQQNTSLHDMHDSLVNLNLYNDNSTLHFQWSVHSRTKAIPVQGCQNQYSSSA